MSECSAAREQSEQGGTSERVSGASKRTSERPSSSVWILGCSGPQCKSPFRESCQTDRLTSWSTRSRFMLSTRVFFTTVSPASLALSLLLSVFRIISQTRSLSLFLPLSLSLSICLTATSCSCLSLSLSIRGSVFVYPCLLFLSMRCSVSV